VPKRDGRTSREGPIPIACEDGRPIDASADLREWSAVLTEAGLPPAGTHTVRHSAATIALDEGIALAAGVGAGQVEPPVGIEPTTYSLRVNRSAD
jgi:hypothetical protein